MKHLILVCLLSLIFVASAQQQSIDDMERDALKDLLAENWITQLEYNDRMARLDYKRQLEFQAAQSQSGSQAALMLGPGGTASISGTIQSGGLDAENVNVNLRDFVTNAYVGNATTDQFGAFTIANLAAGDYYLVTDDFADDYINAMWSSSGTIQCQYCQPEANSIITLANAEVRTGVDMSLEVGASRAGNVAEGVNNLDGVYVSINHTDNQSFFSGAHTDASGNYIIKGIPAGDYYLQVSNLLDVYIDAMWSSTGTVQCSRCVPDTDSTLTLAAAEVRNGVDFSLTIGATITGQLVDDATTDPVDTLNISLFDPLDPTNGWISQTTFDGSGNYTISGIPTGAYKLYLSPDIQKSNEHIPEIYNNIQCNACSTLLFDGAGDTVNVVNGATTANIDFMVEFGASISGIILNNDYPTETVQQSALIYLFNDANRVLALQFLNGTDFDASADGQYKVGGLLPGMYFVQGGDRGREFFQRELFENIACPWSGCDRGAGGDPVVLGANEQRLGVNLLLNYGGKISGTVTDASSGLPIDTGITEFVQFYDSAGEVAGGAFINTDGTYISARALPPGTYSVRTGTMFNGVFISPYVMQKYAPGGNIDCPGVTCDLTAGNVTVSAYARQNPRDPVAEAAAATVTGIDFALSPAFSFSGTITELGSATPIPDVHVLVYDAAGNFANWTTTDSVGDFIVSGLPAGTYYALTNNGSNLPFLGVNQTAAGGWIDILFDGTPCPGSACDVTTGDPIVLGGPGAAEGLNGAGGPVYDFGLNAGGTITGQVRNADSLVPASGVNVNVYNSSGDFFGSYQSDDDGQYMTVGFPPGTYYLTTSNNGALLDIKYGGDYCLDESCDPLDAVPLVITGNEALVDRDLLLKPDFIFKQGLE